MEFVECLAIVLVQIAVLHGLVRGYERYVVATRTGVKWWENVRQRRGCTKKMAQSEWIWVEFLTAHHLIVSTGIVAGWVVGLDRMVAFFFLLEMAMESLDLLAIMMRTFPYDQGFDSKILKSILAHHSLPVLCTIPAVMNGLHMHRSTVVIIISLLGVGGFNMLLGCISQRIPSFYVEQHGFLSMANLFVFSFGRFVGFPIAIMDIIYQSDSWFLICLFTLCFFAMVKFSTGMLPFHYKKVHKFQRFEKTSRSMTQMKPIKKLHDRKFYSMTM